MERKSNITKSKDLTFRCCIHICYGLGLWYIGLIIKCCGWLGWLYICISGRCSYILGSLIASNLVNTQTGMRTNQKCNQKFVCKVLNLEFFKPKIMKQKFQQHKIEKKKRPLLQFVWHHRIEQLHM